MNLVRRPNLSGAIYGVFVYAFMNLVVLPLSRVPPRAPFPAVVVIGGLLAHVFLVGIPIALSSRRAHAAQR